MRAQSSESSESHPAATCLLCGGRCETPVFPFSTTWAGKTFVYLKCATCASASIWPTPTAQDFEEMYSYDHYHAEHYSEVTSAAYEVSAAYLMRHVPTVQRLLDFGCGVGGFLVAAAARGVDAHGVEFHPSAVERAATATGLPVTLLADIEAADAKFDVIHLGDVLEHLPEPEATMRTLAQRLAPNGCFFVEGPIEQNLSVVRAVAATLKTAGRKVGRHASGSLPPFHLTFTTAASQQHFFNTVLKYRTERFDVSETGWPYVSVSGTNHSLSAKVRRLLGTLAVEASRLNAFLPDELKLANRFTAIVRPTGS